MDVALEQTLERQHAYSFAQGVARYAERGGQCHLRECRSGTQLTGKDALAEDSCYLICNTDAMNP